MTEPATKQDIKDALVPVYDRFDQIDERLDKMDKRFDKMDKRFDKMDDRFDKMDERFDKMENRFDGVETDHRRMLVQHEQMQSKLDAILEYVSDVPAIKPRLAQLEDTVAEEKSKTKLNRYHLNELRRDVDAHGRQPHPAK